jgi:NTP pyrophosphatase (non-canonical NTP hydrolase)
MTNLLTKVINDLQDREARGIEKYGTNMDRTDIKTKDWQKHLYEELLDAALYCKKMQEPSIAIKACETFDNKQQIIKAIEEMAELSKELAKELNDNGNEDNIREEIADVMIMMEQMVFLFDVKNEIAKWRENKLFKLAKLIEDAEN